jgi:Fe-S oxidoreductase
VQEPRLLLRGGRRPDVDGRTDRQGINAERVDEALATDPDTVSTACPYCLVMLGDAISAKKASGEARETLEVVDVAQVLMRSVAPSAKTAGPAAQTKRPPA